MGGVQVAPDCCVNVPLLQTNVALPELAPLAVTDVDKPEFTVVVVPEHVLEPTVQLLVVAAHTGEQVAPDCCVNVPLLQANVALPEVAPVAVAVVVEPEFTVLVVAEHELPPTLQLLDVAVHWAGALQLAPACAVNVPLLHANAALPKLVPLAVTDDVEPEFIVEEVFPLHTLDPTVQLTGLDAVHGAPQLAPDCATNVPPLHLNVALPVLGASAVTSVVEPESVLEEVVALHVVDPLVQLTDFASGHAGPQPATVFTANVPALHANVALPVLVPVALTIIVEPELVMEEVLPLHELDPSFQFTVVDEGHPAGPAEHRGESFAFTPTPLHVQFHGPVPVTLSELMLPAAHKYFEGLAGIGGLTAKGMPLVAAAPHAPSIAGAEGL